IKIPPYCPHPNPNPPNPLQEEGGCPMSVQAAGGSSTPVDFSAFRAQLQKPHRHHPPMTKDQLTQLDNTLKADGKHTSALDKILAKFDQMDTDGDGKLSRDEMKAGAEKLGIQWPQRPPKGEPPPFVGGPPPGFFVNGQAAGSGSPLQVSGDTLMKLL